MRQRIGSALGIAFTFACVLGWAATANAADDCIPVTTKENCLTQGWGPFDIQYWFYECWKPACEVEGGNY